MRQFRETTAEPRKQERLLVRREQHVEPSVGQNGDDAFEITLWIKAEARPDVQPTAIFRETSKAERIGVDYLSYPARPRAVSDSRAERLDPSDISTRTGVSPREGIVATPLRQTTVLLPS
jgi:hypothetical protein